MPPRHCLRLSEGVVSDTADARCCRSTTALRVTVAMVADIMTASTSTGDADDGSSVLAASGSPSKWPVRMGQQQVLLRWASAMDLRQRM
jgi:hypothetical protein